MGLFSSIKHAFQHIGKAIEHVAKDVVHGIENVAKDIGHAAEAALHVANDLAHLRLRDALNDTAHMATSLVKGLTDIQKTTVDAAADATAEMHISKAFDKMAQGVKNIENNFSRGTVKLVGDVGATLANSAANSITSGLRMTRDIATGHFKAAVHEGSQLADKVGHSVGELGHEAASAATLVTQTAVSVQKLTVDAAASTVASLHISKSIDRAAEKTAQFVDKAENTVVKVVDQVGKGVASDLDGAVKGTIGATKELVSGHVGKAFSEGVGAAGNALSLAADLTPEGLIANATVATMQAAHIGGKMMQDVVGGVVGGPKGLLKRAAETGAGVGAGVVLEKAGAAAGTPEGQMALIGAGVAADLVPGRRGGAHAEGAHPAPHGGECPGASPPHTDGPPPAPGTGHEPKADGKPEAKADDSPPPKPAPRAWNEVLGVGPNATRAEINKAYRTLSLQHHPDKGGDVEKQKEINQARDQAIAHLEHQSPTPTGGRHTTGADKEPSHATTHASQHGQGTDMVSVGDLHTSTKLSVVDDKTTKPGVDPAAGKELADGKPGKADKDGKVDGGATGAAGAEADAAATVASSNEAALAIIMAQNALAQIQNKIALNQAQNSVIEELGKGVKALAQ